MHAELVVHEGQVRAEWIDYNGHMNDACYVRVFSESIDRWLDCIGMDDAFRSRERVSVYTLQTVVHYLKEIGPGAPYVVTARVLEHDSKKCRVFLTMRHPIDAGHFATMEALLLHVDMTLRRSTAFRAQTLARLDALLAAQRESPWPVQAGRGISLVKGQ